MKFTRERRMFGLQPTASMPHSLFTRKKYGHSTVFGSKIAKKHG